MRESWPWPAALLCLPHKWHICGRSSRLHAPPPANSHPLATTRHRTSMKAAHRHQENTTQGSGPRRPWKWLGRCSGREFQGSGYLGQTLSGFLISWESQRKARVGPRKLRDQDRGSTGPDLRMKSTMSLTQHPAEQETQITCVHAHTHWGSYPSLPSTTFCPRHQLGCLLKALGAGQFRNRHWHPTAESNTGLKTALWEHAKLVKGNEGSLNRTSAAYLL